MKVKELIVELEKCNPEKEVWTEGCDCWGNTVKIKEDADTVLIERDN